MTLDMARRGQHLVVERIDDAEARQLALRLGIAEGSHFECRGRLPGGPVVIRQGWSEIGVGQRLAKRIYVDPDEAPAVTASGRATNGPGRTTDTSSPSTLGTAR